MEELLKNKEFERINHRSPFKVPDGYFDTLTDRVMASVENAEPAREKGMIIRLRPIMWIAASILLVALCIYFPTKSAIDERNALAQDEITILEMYAWFNENEILDAANDKSSIFTTTDDEELENAMLSRFSEYELYLASF